MDAKNLRELSPKSLDEYVWKRLRLEQGRFKQAEQLFERGLEKAKEAGDEEGIRLCSESLEDVRHRMQRARRKESES